MKTKTSIADLKYYLEDLLTTDPILQEKGTKEEIARVERVIENMKKEKKEEKVSNVFKTFQELLDYIDDNPVTDEQADDGEGVDTWRSERFGRLIGNAREELEKLAQLPYPPSAEIVACFGEKEPPVTMSSLSFPVIDENGISYVPRIQVSDVAKLRK